MWPQCGIAVIIRILLYAVLPDSGQTRQDAADAKERQESIYVRPYLIEVCGTDFYVFSYVCALF